MNGGVFIGFECGFRLVIIIYFIGLDLLHGWEKDVIDVVLD